EFAVDANLPLERQLPLELAAFAEQRVHLSCAYRHVGLLFPGRCARFHLLLLLAEQSHGCPRLLAKNRKQTLEVFVTEEVDLDSPFPSPVEKPNLGAQLALQLFDHLPNLR